jgi:hypothetical protein
MLAVLGFVALGVTSCSGGSNSPGVVMIQAGQAQPGAIPIGTHAKTAGDATAATVPLAQQNPTTALFSAIGVFQSCLNNLGVTFVGAPDPSDPSSPANNPSYLKNLGTCATKSNILQALKEAQSAQDNLTPAQVQKENKEYLKWRKCMIGRGWGIPQPTPNAKGLLFSFGGTGGGGGAGAGGGFKAPPGQSLLNSSDLEQCAAVAQGST